MSTIDHGPCDPPIVPIRIGDAEAPNLTTRLRELFADDQAARQTNPIDWDALLVADAQRRREVLSHLVAGQIGRGESLYHAAFIFQHGACPEHFQLAHQLAEAALAAGFEQARWIYAATLDRYLLSIGQPQKYGTQFLVGANGQWVLRPYDPTTTDEERRRYNVPPLDEQLRRRG